eukprot:sb/3468962/
MSMKLGIVNIQPPGQSPPWGFFDWSSGSKVTKIISRTGRLISNSRDRTSIHTLNNICTKFGGPIFKGVEMAASPPTKQDFRVYHCRFCVMRAILEKCIHPTTRALTLKNFFQHRRKHPDFNAGHVNFLDPSLSASLAPPEILTQYTSRDLWSSPGDVSSRSPQSLYILLLYKHTCSMMVSLRHCLRTLSHMRPSYSHRAEGPVQLLEAATVVSISTPGVRSQRHKYTQRTALTPGNILPKLL